VQGPRSDLTRAAWLFAAAFLASCCLVVEHDAPWYLACGDLILRTRSLPLHDPFSFTSTIPWLNHEWLSEILLALVYRAGGWKALSLLCALGVAGVVAIAAYGTRRSGGIDAGAAFVWALLVVVLRESFAPRATLFADLAFVSTLVIVMLDDEDGRRLWWCIPIQLVWTQLHGGNPLGVVLLALRFLTGPSARRALVAVLAALATMAGPYGWRVHAHFAGAHGSLQLIREWQSLVAPLLAGAMSAWIALALVIAALTMTVVALRRTPSDARARFTCAAVFVFGVAALRWSRFVTEASIVAAVALAPVVGRAWSSRFVCVAGIAIAVVVGVIGPRTPGLGLDARAFPTAAVAWLRENHPSGPMFNSYNFGGYLLWARPEERVFIDGRAFTVYDPTLLAVLSALYADPRQFASLVARYDLKLAVLQRGGRGAAFDAWLSAQGNWSRLHRDPLADIFVRTTP
jgi:hypothetical protein